MVRPSHRREMAVRAVAEKGLSVTLACRAFGISEACYRYQPKLRPENAVIADWLVRLTDNHRNWGFGLCFLYLRNVRGHGWNHKRVYRIYRELELNLRIRPKRRMVREKPDTSAQTWPWAASHPNSGWPWPHSSTSKSPEKWGDYPTARLCAGRLLVRVLCV